MLILPLQANARDGIHGNKALKNIDDLAGREANVSYSFRLNLDT